MPSKKKWHGWRGNSAPVVRTNASVAEARGAPATGRIRQRGRSKAQQPNWNLWLCVALFFVTFFTYAQVRHFDCVHVDDERNLSRNPHVLAGFTPDAVHWAFTSLEGVHWIPLTVLSHALDCELFGSDWGLHHLTSVVLHAIAAMLLFAFLKRGTAEPWPSAFVAAVFALHPLNTEPVCWLSARNDVLCGCFWFLALYAYSRYATDLTRKWYVITLLVFILGLLSKPMIVTLPAQLLLLDFWPFRRLSASGYRAVWRLLREKIPFFGLSLLFGLISYFTHAVAGDIVAKYPVLTRMGNALVLYVVYLFQTIWPIGLFASRPYVDYTFEQQLIAGFFLVGVSFAAWFLRTSSPWLLVGWLWYLVTLLPVIRLIPIGTGLEGSADRYMYVPLVGLAVIVAWTARAAWPRYRRYRTSIALLGLSVCAVCASLSNLQAKTWANSVALFQNAADANNAYFVSHQNNFVARANNYESLLHYGTALLEANDAVDAASQYEAAIRLLPNRPEAHLDLGSSLLYEGSSASLLARAISQCRKGVEIAPRAGEAHFVLAMALIRDPNQRENAKTEFHEARRLEPNRFEEWLSRYPELHIQ